MTNFISKVKKHAPLLLLLPLFFLLLARNPFSTRTLIPNFEPFPDGFHYVTSSRCILEGYGRNLCREGRVIKPSVPPLYSWYLLPFFLTNNDARMFYFGNVLLSIISLIIFYLLVRRFISHKSMQFLVLLLYVGNYFTYWYPTLAMAENLLIPIFLLCLYLLTKPVTNKRAVVFSLATFCLFGAKYSAAPIVLVFYLLYWAKAFGQRNQIKHISKLVGMMFIATIFGFLISGGVELIYRGINLVQNIVFKERLGLETNEGSSAAWISTVFITKNLPLYLRAVTGGSIRTLWVESSLVPQLVGVIGMGALVLSSFRSKFAGYSRSILALFAVQIGFLSLFYSFESRYILYAIPVLILSFGIAVDQVSLFFQKKLSMKTKKYVPEVIAGFMVLIFLSINLLSLKNQIMLNLRHAETPWWYLSVVELNTYFRQSLGTKPIVITAISPYLVDYYANGNFELLPLSSQQDFNRDVADRNAAWGISDSSDLIGLYKQKLEENNVLYVINYGLGHESDKIEAFKSVQNNFSLELVQSGCYELCNIYRLHLQ